jgi:plastocyanin
VRRHLALLCAAVLAAIALGSCGGDDDSDAAPDRRGDGVIEVVARDIEFGESEYGTNAGDVRLRYVNQGSIAHTLLIDDVDGFKLEVAGNGDDDQGSVQLGPGTYTLYCDVPGHREAGMEATLEVT